jgi:antitoxin component YwqK of YwqJK toxin-antitoxin module
MKLILHALLLFIFSTKLFSQNGVTSKIIYLDSIFIESTEENCRYIRIIEDYYSDRKSYVYKDYYKSEAIKSIGTSLNKDYIEPEGQFITYYENGNKKSITTFANNKEAGKALLLHPIGAAARPKNRTTFFSYLY